MKNKKIIAGAVSLLAASSLLTSCLGNIHNNLEDKIGVCTSVGNADKVLAAGGAYIEVGAASYLMPEKSDSAFASNAGKAENAVLPVLSSNSFYPGDQIKLVGPEADPERAVKFAATAIERARTIGIHTMVLGSGRARNVPEGFSKETAEEQFITLCRRIGDVAAANGITVVLEPLRSEETNFLNSVREATALAKKIANPGIKVLADFYHMAQEGEDANAIVEAGDLLKHCHIAEGEERTCPGVAGDDFTPYFKALRKINYKGYISIECRWDDFDSQVGPAIAEMKRQIHLINN